MAAPTNFILSERALDERTALLSAEGDTNAAAAERLCRQVTSIAEHGKVVVIADLTGVTFIDSAVVQGLREAGLALQGRDARLIVVEPLDPKIAHPFELGALDQAAVLVPTLEAAARAASLPNEMLGPAIPAAPLPPPSTTRPRRSKLGRRELDQEILRELAQLRRSVHELQRDPDEQAPTRIQTLEGELERARAQIQALEAELAELRSKPPGSG